MDQKTTPPCMKYKTFNDWYQQCIGPLDTHETKGFETKSHKASVVPKLYADPQVARASILKGVDLKEDSKQCEDMENPKIRRIIKAMQAI